MADARNKVAIKYALMSFTTKRDIIKTIVPNSLVLGSSL
jgi:hypothetical protein